MDRKALAYNSRVCIEFGYPLKRLPKERACSECGVLDTAEDLAGHWKAWLNTGVNLR